MKANKRNEMSATQTTMQNDPALVAFEKLKVREVRPLFDQTASAFLAQFQSTAASLEPDERIKLKVVCTNESMELLKAVLDDPQANKVCSLVWRYDEKQDVNSVIPLLINNCPELASLRVEFGNHFAFDFVSSLLEHPSNKIKVLEMPPNTKGDLARFFAALGQSQVAALALSLSPKSVQGWHEYLAKDMLVRLKVRMGNRQVPSKMMMSLVDCTRLTKLEMVQCKFSQPTAFTHLPKSITTLTLSECTFVGGFDWSFLADSNVRELGLDYGKGVDGNQFGGALAVHLRAKGLAELRLVFCDFVNETLAKVGIEIGRIKRFEGNGHLNTASIELIALALQSPNSELRELMLLYGDNTASSIKDHLVPTLKHPNCNLIKLSLLAYQHKVAAKAVEDMFRNRLALFVLLQGRQVRRLYCPLRRLPVEMLRLVARSGTSMDGSSSCRTALLDGVFEGLATGQGRSSRRLGRKLPVCACDEELFRPAQSRVLVEIIR
ncbi:hypothetical protein BASA82_000621 [Batrachochytrium salamandrivorans]|nr:hypothetical protein BASA82_000621 [Batrachochytrium salamandrivorans]